MLFAMSGSCTNSALYRGQCSGTCAQESSSGSHSYWHVGKNIYDTTQSLMDIKQAAGAGLTQAWCWHCVSCCSQTCLSHVLGRVLWVTACAVHIWDLLDNSSCRDLGRSCLCYSPPSLVFGSEGVNPSGLLCLSRGGKPKSMWGELPRLGPKRSSVLYLRAFCSSEISHSPKSLFAASKFLSPFTEQDFKPKPNTIFINNTMKEKRNHNFLCRFTAVLMVFTLHFHTSVRRDLPFQHALHTGLQL